MIAPDPPPPFRSVRAALERLALARLAQASHCAVAEPGRVRGASDPERLAVEIATVAHCMRDCTDAERVALELESVHGDLPVEQRHDRQPGTRRGYAQRRRLSKCGVLALVLGRRSLEPERYYEVVDVAYRKFRAALARAGLLA